MQRNDLPGPEEAKPREPTKASSEPLDRRDGRRGRARSAERPISSWRHRAVFVATLTVSLAACHAPPRDSDDNKPSSKSSAQVRSSSTPHDPNDPLWDAFDEAPGVSFVVDPTAPLTEAALKFAADQPVSIGVNETFVMFTFQDAKEPRGTVEYTYSDGKFGPAVHGSLPNRTAADLDAMKFGFRDLDWAKVIPLVAADAPKHSTLIRPHLTTITAERRKGALGLRALLEGSNGVTSVDYDTSGRFLAVANFD